MNKYIFDEKLTWLIEAEDVDKAWELLNSPHRANLEQVELINNTSELRRVFRNVSYSKSDPNHSMNLPK